MCLCRVGDSIPGAWRDAIDRVILSISMVACVVKVGFQLAVKQPKQIRDRKLSATPAGSATSRANCIYSGA